MSTHRNRSRGGFSLTELSATMAAGSTLMMLAVGMLHQSFLWSSIARQRENDDRRFDRLQRQFRIDVHAARQATLQQQVLSLTTIDQGVITYSVAESGDVQRREQTAAGELKESFPWTDSLQVSLLQQDQPKRMVLSARRIPKVAEQPPIWRHVEAVVGFSNRHKFGELTR